MLTKIVSDCADVPSGSTFQTLGPATVKALQTANSWRPDEWNHQTTA